MQKLLIISSTKNSNFDLSKSIKSYIKETKDLNCEIVSLEDFDLPLYTPTLEEKFKKNQSFPQNIEKSKNLICSSNAIIWCSPEYNGGISPIVTNAIAWISRATEDWKEGFKDKPLNDSLTLGSSSVSLKSLTTKSNVPYSSTVLLDFLMCSIENLNLFAFPFPSDNR